MKYIDIEATLKKSKNKGLNKLPSFVYFLFRTIICEEEMNRILNKYSESIGVNFLQTLIKEFNLNVIVEGKENLPDNGKCFFVANHPFGIIDGLILTNIVAEKYGTFKAIGNDVFIMIPHLKPLIAAVGIFNLNSKEYLNELNKVYSSDIPITHFPAGEVSRVYNWKIQDGIWQKSFINKAVTQNRCIVPFYFYGRNSLLFYSVYVIRKFLRIKANVELILLPREMLKKRNKTVKVKIGKPIIPEKFDESINSLKWAQKVREYVYNMEKSNIFNNF